MSKRTLFVPIIDSYQGKYLNFPDIEQTILEDIAEVTLYKVSCAEDLAGKIDEADVIISWHTRPIQV